MKQLIKFGLCLIFSIYNYTVLFAQVADALVITPEGNVQVPAGNLDVKGNVAASGNLDVKGNVTTTGNINTNGKLMENGYALLPKGSIILWYGTATDVPQGWIICDGKDNITPNLSGRFVVGAGSNGESTYNPRDNSGGRDMQTLTTDQMPSHTHGLYSPNSSRVLSSTAYQRDKDSGMGATHSIYDTGSDKEVRLLQDAISMNNSGNNQAFDNRPKYYALYYIMKL